MIQFGQTGSSFHVSENYNTNTLGRRITKSKFDVDSHDPAHIYYQNRENTAPTTVEESNARVSSKIDERFKSHSIRNVSNISSQNNAR